jgi:hypothetical protein
MTRTVRFDAAAYLDTEEHQVAYIATALKSGDAHFVRGALGLVGTQHGWDREEGRLESREPLQRGDRQSRIRYGHAYCSRPGSHALCAPCYEWIDVEAAQGRLNGGEDNTFAGQGMGQHRTGS